MRPISFIKVVGLLSLCPAFCQGAAAQTDPPAKSPEKKIPDGVDPKMTSDDADYGYSKKKPIKVGSKDEYGGPAAERVYLDGVRDEEGKPIKYKRLGSVGKSPDGNIMDLYEVTASSGKKIELYIDMYNPKNDPEKQSAPKGLYKAKK